MKQKQQSTLEEFITFLKEYNKLLERGISNILVSSHANNFIWADDICKLEKNEKCETSLFDIFDKNDKNQNSRLLKLTKPQKLAIKISDSYSDFIEFDEASNKFISINNDENELKRYKQTEEYKEFQQKIEDFIAHKTIYSKLYTTHFDIQNDSNTEIVLSIGLIQFSQKNKNGKLSIVNQHLFHFPLSTSIDATNHINISFSNEIPYTDPFFFNKIPIEKQALLNIIDRFKQEIENDGFEYLFSEDFRKLIENIQGVSANTYFAKDIFRPERNTDKKDYFKISFSPAISIKKRKPRFFQKMMDNIIELNKEKNIDVPLFDLMIRNPEANNDLEKHHYFKGNFFNEYVKESNNLDREDFSTFFPLPSNDEQKKIYENHLKKRLTVVTGAPGTGKSHTIVNILCALLAEGKRVLVTAETDKALESLLAKIPKVFDNLIFTKIELATDKNRFSLEGSIDKLSDILREDFRLNIPQKIKELDYLKGEYVDLKTKIIKALEKEYNNFDLNEGKFH